MLQDLRLRIHRKLIDTLDLSKLSNLEMERVQCGNSAHSRGHGHGGGYSA